MRVIHISFLIALAGLACDLGEDTGTSVQEISYCPYPPVRCQPTSVIADGICMQACVDQGGVAAYCPDLTPSEGVACADSCNPLYPVYSEAWFGCMTDCGDRVRHQCMGGWEQ